MKKLSTLILSAFIIFSFWGCGTMRPLTSDRKPHEIDTVFACHLPSIISAIEKGNQAKYHQAYSDSAFYLRYHSFKNTMPSTGTIKHLGVKLHESNITC